MQGCKPTSLNEICETCDLIISATGRAAIKPQHYEMMKDNVVIGTATSPDDELDIDTLLDDGILQKQEQNSLNATYKTPSGKTVNLLLDGEAVNTYINSGGVNDPSIYLINAATIAALVKTLATPKNEQELGKINPLAKEDVDLVTKIWLEHYFDYSREKENFTGKALSGNDTQKSQGAAR